LGAGRKVQAFERSWKAVDHQQLGQPFAEVKPGARNRTGHGATIHTRAP
jgi:hypothetical protein